LNRSVRPYEPADVRLIPDYFLHAKPGYPEGMGVDPTQRAAHAPWEQNILTAYGLPFDQKPVW
jgi:hypothetical protein